jgi:transposase-like protein
MKKERRNYDKEFKLMAVELCYAGKPTKEVAGNIILLIIHYILFI